MIDRKIRIVCVCDECGTRERAVFLSVKNEGVPRKLVEVERKHERDEQAWYVSRGWVCRDARANAYYPSNDPRKPSDLCPDCAKREKESESR